MGNIAVRAEGLGKRYRIGGAQAHYRTLRETVMQAATAPVRRLRSAIRDRSANTSDQTIWALKDVSFEIPRGEAVGIIGRNGAGKSTLLKILSRITKPTEGGVDIYGRVGSLLEVGTGFHQELTGRENIYLNGAILGMKRAEIRRKFDEIVGFAGIDKFIDTPVKHYSSGMYMRLAFGVAAHLEPEILVVDEVLAVGDAEFQKKCLRKMGDVANEGRTVLFVSHNMSAIQRLCKTAFLLDNGFVVAQGNVDSVVDTYHKTSLEREDSAATDHLRTVPPGSVRFTNWKIHNSPTGDPYTCYTNEPCVINLRLVARRVVEQANFGIAMWTSDGMLAWAMRNLDNGGECVVLTEGVYEVQFAVSLFPLRPGLYQLHVSVNDLSEGTLDSWYLQPTFQILPKHESGLPPQWQGILNMSGKFNLTCIEEMSK